MLARNGSTWTSLTLVASLAACTAVVEGVGGHDKAEGGSTVAGAGGATTHGGPTAAGGSAGGANLSDGSAGGPGSAGRSNVDGGDAHNLGPEDANSGTPDVRGDGTVPDSGAAVSDGGFVGPVVPPDCPGDPTQGWTEYSDT